MVLRVPCCVINADAACEAFLVDRRSGELSATLTSSILCIDVGTVEAKVNGVPSRLCVSSTSPTQSDGGNSSSSNSQAGVDAVPRLALTGVVTFFSASEC